jgi:hypothetical protein
MAAKKRVAKKKVIYSVRQEPDGDYMIYANNIPLDTILDNLDPFRTRQGAEIYLKSYLAFKKKHHL